MPPYCIWKDERCHGLCFSLEAWIKSLREGMSIVAVGLIVGALSLVIGALVWLYFTLRRPDDLEELGVSTTYPRNCLPSAKIEAYHELKEKFRDQYASKLGSDGSNDLWMSQLPAQAKDMLKYRLMQRAIGDMAALQKIDADARGYWRLFSKGIISKTFWNSVVETERELSAELEGVKAEAANVEPTQDPQGIISEAMQFVLRYGDKLPSAADVANTADAIADLMKQMPPGGMPPGGMHPGMSPGLPPGVPPGMPPHGHGPPPGHPMMRPPAPPVGTEPQPQPAPQDAGGDTYRWKQDNQEVEVSVSVPDGATKAQVKVSCQAKSLRVAHNGTVLVDGPLFGRCDPEGSTWTLGKGRVVVSLEKTDPRPWSSLFAKAS